MSDQLFAIEERALEGQAVAVRASSKDVGCPVCQMLLKGIPTLADDVLVLAGVVRKLRVQLKDTCGDKYMGDCERCAKEVADDKWDCDIGRALAECNALLEEKPCVLETWGPLSPKLHPCPACHD